MIIKFDFIIESFIIKTIALLNLYSKSQKKHKNVEERYRNGNCQAPKTDEFLGKVCLKPTVFTFKPICILPLPYGRETFLPSRDQQKVWALELHRPSYVPQILLLKVIWPWQSLCLSCLLHKICIITKINNITWDWRFNVAI